jgi:hypothetical protein
MDGLSQYYYEGWGDLINQDQGRDMTRISYLFYQDVEFAVVKPVHGQMPFLTAPAPSLGRDTQIELSLSLS